MNAIESIELPKVLGLVAKPRYILGTTYTLSLAFFESAVFPDLDRSQLKSCLIICDALGYQNALTEAPALQGAAQDYLVVPAPVLGSFHAKVWIVVGDGEFVLLTGSGNLTQAGFIDNAELFDATHCNADALPTANLMADVRSFIQGLAGIWPAASRHHLLCVDALNEIDVALSQIPVNQTDNASFPRFLHSLRGPLIDQLPATPSARELFVASPYFGDSLQGLDLLTARFPASRLKLFPAVHHGSSTNIPLDQVRAAHQNARIAGLTLPAKKKAFCHLKLYGASTPDGFAWAFCGSANCTQAAWVGPNVEAGLLRQINPAFLKELFIPSAYALPAERLHQTTQHESSPTLRCWATDTSEGLEVHMDNEDQSRFPLRDVTLQVRAGSHLATFQAKALFQSSTHVHLPWESFQGWQRRRKVALCLQLEATDVEGCHVCARCLVENRLLLSADPSHRSAWRGAQALLDAEGAPEMGDIAAIFSMARDVFGGKLLSVPASQPTDGSKEHQQDDEEEVFVVAAWPPQPDSHELHKRLHSTALGQLKWFQHILNAFLKNPTLDELTHGQRHPHTSHATTEDEDPEEGSGSDTAKQEVRTIKQAEKIWKNAHADYQRLRNKIGELCPTAFNAQNIWPVAIFAFLSTMAVFHSAKRKAPDLPAKTGLDEGILCDDFFRAMFNHRPQDEDYCPPKGFRYRQEKFPPLADDLLTTFNVRLHPDLASVILALAIDRYLRIDNPILRKYPPLSKDQLEIVCDETFVANADMRDACRRIWRRYLCSESRKDSDTAFGRQFNALFNIDNETVLYDHLAQ